MPPVKMEYELDTIRVLSPELGVPPPTRSKGKNHACSISPINLISDDEIPVDVVEIPADVVEKK